MKQQNGKLADMLERTGVLLLFSVFILLLLIVLSNGVSNYRSIAGEQKRQFETRTCLNYVVSKIRHGDRAGLVYPKDFLGAEALWLEEKTSGETYYTVIYFSDGYVKELYAQQPQDLDLDAGEDIMPADSFTVQSKPDGRLFIACVIDGACDEIVVYPMSQR